MINETITQIIPTGYVPNYFLYIVVTILLLSFVSITSAYKSRKTNWGNFWMVILFSTLIIAIVTGFLIAMPDMFANWITKFTSLFS